MKAWLFLIALVGCAKSSPSSTRSLSGLYTMVQGGFNEALNIQLAADGSYILDHELFACVIGPNGEMPLTCAREAGTWTIESGLVVLRPRARSPDFPDANVFAPAFARRLRPQGQGLNASLVNADYPSHFVFKKTDQAQHLFGPPGDISKSIRPRP